MDKILSIGVIVRIELVGQVRGIHSQLGQQARSNARCFHAAVNFFLAFPRKLRVLVAHLVLHNSIVMIFPINIQIFELIVVICQVVNIIALLIPRPHRSDGVFIYIYLIKRDVALVVAWILLLWAGHGLYVWVRNLRVHVVIIMTSVSLVLRVVSLVKMLLRGRAHRVTHDQAFVRWLSMTRHALTLPHLRVTLAVCDLTMVTLRFLIGTCLRAVVTVLNRGLSQVVVTLRRSVSRNHPWLELLALMHLPLPLLHLPLPLLRPTMLFLSPIRHGK